MGQIFNRFERLVRSMVQDNSMDSSPYGDDIHDEDMRAAWDELNKFLDEDDFIFHETTSGTTGKAVQEELRKDYTVLSVPFGADFPRVKKAYRDCLRTYHPDLQGSDPQKQKNATEMTRKVIHSYRRIKRFYETGEV